MTQTGTPACSQPREPQRHHLLLPRWDSGPTEGSTGSSPQACSGPATSWLSLPSTLTLGLESFKYSGCEEQCPLSRPPRGVSHPGLGPVSSMFPGWPGSSPEEDARAQHRAETCTRPCSSGLSVPSDAGKAACGHRHPHPGDQNHPQGLRRVNEKPWLLGDMATGLPARALTSHSLLMGAFQGKGTAQGALQSWPHCRVTDPPGRTTHTNNHQPCFTDREAGDSSDVN